LETFYLLTSADEFPVAVPLQQAPLTTKEINEIKSFQENGKLKNKKIVHQLLNVNLSYGGMRL
jgi:hypothetical protein